MGHLHTPQQHPPFLPSTPPYPLAPARPACPTCRPLSGEDRTLLWRFRFALTSDARALTKFLKCVDWSDASEARQAAELMQQWAPIDVADALELLSPDFVNEEVGVGTPRGEGGEVMSCPCGGGESGRGRD